MCVREYGMYGHIYDMTCVWPCIYYRVLGSIVVCRVMCVGVCMLVSMYGRMVVCMPNGRMYGRVYGRVMVAYAVVCMVV